MGTAAHRRTAYAPLLLSARLDSAIIGRSYRPRAAQRSSPLSSSFRAFTSRPSLRQPHPPTRHARLIPPVCSSSTPASPHEDATIGVAEILPNAPLPGSNFYLGAAGAVTALALAVPLAISAQHLSVSLVSHYTMLELVYGFALAHSGLASLRPAAVRVIGERLYRVLFALVALPGAGLTISYFIAHRYDGVQLWTLQGVPGLHEAVYVVTFISFLLLYPATFNLAEVAAIKKPGLRIYEKGVMRITRHPQLWGQVLWCVAHTAWMGTSLTLTASLGLVAHHLFAVWNGDRRLRDRYGEEWEAYASRTSVLPFRAIADGRQKIVWEELAAKAYIGVIVFIVGTYAAHPLLLRGVASLNLNF
jgi:uncharacterized membrane protein